jgi:hypothetical protein
MTLTKLICIVAALIAASCLIVAQSREDGVAAIQSKLLDAPSATYKLEASRNGRGYQFCNASAVRVIRFRLGCVETRGVKYKILTQRPFENGDLEAADARNLSCRFWDSNHGFFPGEACKKGKLAVTEAALADDTVWKLKP